MIRYIAIEYSEIYKTLMKEIENDTKKWKDIPSSWFKRTNTLKMSILHQAMCNVYTTPSSVETAVSV